MEKKGKRKKNHSCLLFKMAKAASNAQNSNFISNMFCISLKISLICILFSRVSPSIAISREDGEDSNHHQHQINHYNHSSSSKRIWKQSWHQHRSGHSNEVPFNGYNSEEYLDRLEPNGNIPNIPANKSDLGYGKRKLKKKIMSLWFFFWMSMQITKFH